MGNKMFRNLSSLYIELWSHLDAYFDDNSRWLRLYHLPNSDERISAIREIRAEISRDLHDPTLAEQVRRDVEDVLALTQEYEEQRPEPGSEWFSRADKRTCLQGLGLRYAEFASAGVAG